MSDKPKIGAGALPAALRQGGKEVGQVLPAFPDSVRVIEEPGTIGNPTPQEIFQAKQGPAPRRGPDIDMDR